MSESISRWLLWSLGKARRGLKAVKLAQHHSCAARELTDVRRHRVTLLPIVFFYADILYNLYFLPDSNVYFYGWGNRAPTVRLHRAASRTVLTGRFAAFHIKDGSCLRQGA